MSDPDLEIIEETTDKQTWARKLMAGVRAVQDLHHPQTMYGGYETQEEAEEAHADGAYETSVICPECSRVAEVNCGGDEWTWEEFPCATAKALGIEEGPIL